MSFNLFFSFFSFLVYTVVYLGVDFLTRRCQVALCCRLPTIDGVNCDGGTPSIRRMRVSREGSRSKVACILGSLGPEARNSVARGTCTSTRSRSRPCRELSERGQPRVFHSRRPPRRLTLERDAKLVEARRRDERRRCSCSIYSTFNYRTLVLTQLDRSQNYVP